MNKAFTSTYIYFNLYLYLCYFPNFTFDSGTVVFYQPVKNSLQLTVT